MLSRIVKVLFCVAALAAIAPTAAGQPARPAAEAPEFTFAVLTDIQYADKDAAGARSYRDSLARLEQSAAAINAGRPAFVVHLGDLIDVAGAGNLDRILQAFSLLQAPKYHLLGNHDFSVSRPELLRRLGMPRAWYDFARRGWRFVVLDGMDVSVAAWPRNDPRYREGEAWLGKLKEGRARNAVDWNGGIGSEQQAWLREVLEAASRRRERVVLLCHFPVLEAAATAAHLLWNHVELVRLIEGSAVVQAWFNGHDHRGGYARQAGIHHVTFPGMVESGEKNSWTMVRVFSDRLELRGAGTAPNRVLDIRR